MKIALIFPGQGSQYIGMGQDFFNSSMECRYIFEKLDDITGRNMKDLIFSGSEEELLKTTNSQPAIMTISNVILSQIYQKGYLEKHSIICVAGHSLGEYSALVANKSISFEDALRLLIIRSNAMQDSMPIGTGGMAAIIGSSEDKINSIINKLIYLGKLFVANDNAEGQIVISGEIKPINFICENYKKLGIKKAIKLPVSAPFHCELIESAAVAFKKATDKFNFKDFTIPFYSNVTAEKCTVKEIKNLLSKQIISKVKWRETIINILKNEVDIFIEIGPGKVLTNLLRRTSREINAISVGNITDLDKLGVELS